MESYFKSELRMVILVKLSSHARRSPLSVFTIFELKKSILDFMSASWAVICHAHKKKIIESNLHIIKVGNIRFLQLKKTDLYF